MANETHAREALDLMVIAHNDLVKVIDALIDVAQLANADNQDVFASAILQFANRLNQSLVVLHHLVTLGEDKPGGSTLN